MTNEDKKRMPFPSGERRKTLVDALRRKTTQFLQDRLENLFTLIDERLFELANNAVSQRDQTHYFDSMRLLRLRRDELGAAILGSAADIFQRIGRPEITPLQHVADSAAGAEQPSDELSLELVKNDVLEEMITLDNMVSRVIERSQPQLDLLTRRLSYVVGHKLSEHTNPFVPEYLCEGFARKTAFLKLDFEPRLAVLKLLNGSILKDWSLLVRDCNDFLREADVLVDLEKRRPVIKKASVPDPVPEQAPFGRARASSLSADHTPAPDVPAAGAGAGAGDKTSLGPGSSRTDKQAKWAARHDVRGRQAATPPLSERNRFSHPEHIYGDVLGDLHRQIRQQARNEREARGESPDQPPLASVNLGVDELAGMIANWRAEFDHGKLLESLAREGLEKSIAAVLAKSNHGLDSLKEIDQSILRLLDKTFGQLNGQTLNPPGLHQVVLKLELPAAWLALKDPTFLERQNHPGRRLINELCKASSTLAEEVAPADPLQGKIDAVIERLNAFDVSVRELTSLLAEFIDFVDKDKRQQAAREQRVLEEEEAQAALGDANNQVVRILTERLVNRRWPRFLVNFCEKAWSRVLFLTCLRHGGHSAEWRDVLVLLDRLLVLVSFPRKLDEVTLDELLASIESHLHHIGYDRSECRHHLDSMRSFFANPSVHSVEGGIDHATLDTLSVELPGEKFNPDEAPVDLDVKMLDLVDTLKKGTWVEFRDEGDNKLLRCKLAGTVNASSKLVFTNRKGAKVAEEYRHRMAVKMQQGKVLVLDNSHLFDQAYDQVIAEIRAENM